MGASTDMIAGAGPGASFAAESPPDIPVGVGMLDGDPTDAARRFEVTEN